MSKAARFWDRHADVYSKKPIKDQASYDQGLDRTRKYLSAGDHVLEIGCGTGTTALLLAPSVKQITATDISSRMVEIGREKAATEGVDNIHFERATLFDADLDRGPFDVITAFNSLHVVGDIPGGLVEIRERLKPGGFFISKTPCVGEMNRLVPIGISVMKLLGLAPPLDYLKATEIEDHITGADFAILETAFCPHPVRFIVARKASWGGDLPNVVRTPR